MKIIRETLPNLWIDPLVNGEYSCLAQSDDPLDNSIIDEVNQLENWQKDHPRWWCVRVYDDSTFCINHDATKYGVLACDCSTFEFHVMDSEN